MWQADVLNVHTKLARKATNCMEIITYATKCLILLAVSIVWIGLAYDGDDYY